MIRLILNANHVAYEIETIDCNVIQCASFMMLSVWVIRILENKR